MPIHHLTDLLESNLPERSGRMALVSADRELTYGELWQEVESAAARLRESGVRPGDRVGIHFPKSLEEVVMTFAIARLGAVFVNLHYQWTEAQVEHIAADCNMRLIVTPAELLAGARSLATPGTAPADLAALLYTSGSTGHPKGVMVTHRNLIDGARIVSGYLRNRTSDHILSVLPLSFDYGLNQITSAMYAGATVVLQPVTMASEIARTVRSAGITGLAAVPTIWIQLVRYLEETGATLPLRYITNSGGSIPTNILNLMPQVFPSADIYLMYGLTEAFRSTYLPPDLFGAKKGAIGIPLPGVDIFVVDSHRGICGPGERGEIIHRGSLMSQGYWNAPDATAEKFKVCDALTPLIGEERVLYSGDIGYRDGDGILWFVERAGAMIKSSGFRISPSEVEQIVCQSGLVDLAVAFGAPDPLLGDAVHVAVSAAGPSAVQEAAIAAYCKRNMPSYMVPRKIHCWEGELPRTSSGKVCRQSVIRSLLPATP